MLQKTLAGVPEFARERLTWWETAEGAVSAEPPSLSLSLRVPPCHFSLHRGPVRKAKINGSGPGSDAARHAKVDGRSRPLSNKPTVTALRGVAGDTGG